MDFQTKYLSKNDIIDTCSCIIYYFINYYQWRNVKDLDRDNQKRINSCRILNFKKGDASTYPYFSYCFKSHLDDFGNEPWIICSIPGHNQVCANMNHIDSFFSKISLPTRFTKVPGLIIRNKVMPEKHGTEYGTRTIQKDLDSFKIGNPINLSEKNVIIFDDITTSGCSLAAARQFLKSNGAKKVVCIALGKTVDEYGWY